jgi:hypothetical protein
MDASVPEHRRSRECSQEPQFKVSRFQGFKVQGKPKCAAVNLALSIRHSALSIRPAKAMGMFEILIN